MIAEIMRHLLWRDRVAAARAWRDAERHQAVERSDAVRRILAQGVTVPDPAGRRIGRAA